MATTKLDTRIDALEDKTLKIAEDMNMMVLKLHEAVISMTKAMTKICTSRGVGRAIHRNIGNVCS